jgi:hypothetical protein
MVVRVCGLMKLESVSGGWGMLYENSNYFYSSEAYEHKQNVG